MLTNALPVTLDDFRVTCENYTLRLSFSLNGKQTRVTMRDLAEAHIYINQRLVRLGAYRQANVLLYQVQDFYIYGSCPLEWRPDEAETS